jgi:sugar/nucleoside kinase (ribokinase family)
VLKILCVGQLSADILVKPVEVVDYNIDTVFVDCIEPANGGDAMNVAVNLARLGVPVRFAGLTGKDGFGAFLRSCLDSLGIASDSLMEDETLPTCSTIVLINSKGARTFLHNPGANRNFSEDLIRDEWLKGIGIVFAGGVYTLPKFDGQGAAKLFRRAKAEGAITAMDVTHDTTDRWIKTIRPCLPELDYFMPSIKEAKCITGKDNPEEIAAALISEGIKTAVVKLGSKGCFVKNRDRSFYQDTYPGAVADTTGAGDSFVAGFLTGLAMGKSLEECSCIACAAGTVTVGRIGATTEALSLETIRRIMGKE